MQTEDLGRLTKLIEKIATSGFTGRIIITFANGKPVSVEEIRKIQNLSDRD